MNVYSFWTAVLKQDKEKIRTYFHPKAKICWHNTNECFNVDEFLIANCEYPGSWRGEVERIVEQGSLIITTTHVYDKNETVSFHVVSFIQLEEDKIILVDEYWGDDGKAPQWRLDKHIGKVIKK